MSEAVVIRAEAAGVDEVPAKLRLLASAGCCVTLRLEAENARALALVVERGLNAERVVDAAAVAAAKEALAQARAAIFNARQHVAEAELLARLWAAMAVAACAVAAVILLLRV
jgi:hypothetical protein